MAITLPREKTLQNVDINSLQEMMAQCHAGVAGTGKHVTVPCSDLTRNHKMRRAILHRKGSCYQPWPDSDY